MLKALFDAGVPAPVFLSDCFVLKRIVPRIQGSRPPAKTDPYYRELSRPLPEEPWLAGPWPSKRMENEPASYRVHKE